MAIIPLSFRLDWSDPSKMGGEMSVLNNNANPATSMATQFNMQDIIDTVAYDAGSVERDGTPIAGYISSWTSPDKIKGQTVSTVAGYPAYGLAGGFTSAYNTSFNSDTP